VGQIDERPPRLNDDDTEDDPTRVSADADPTAIKTTDDDTIATASPPSLRALAIAPVVVSKPIAPLPPMAPIVEPDGDPTEAGVVVRLAALPPVPEREEHTVKLPAVPAAEPAAAAAPAEPPPPCAQAPPVEDDPAADVQVAGLGPDLRAKWFAIAALALVMVWVGGAAVGRMSAPRVEAKPTASSAMPSNDVPVPAAEPAASYEEPATSATSASLNIAPTTRVTPPERRGIVRAAPPSPAPPPAPRPPPVVRSRTGTGHGGGIVRETPF
jgi:hypothetical protein